MAWFVQPMQIADANGQPTGRWRLTATSDEDGGGPFGDVSHSHDTPEECMSCEACDDFCSRRTGFPSRRAEATATTPPRDSEANLRKMLEDANQMLRCAKSIAERYGNATNWEAWNARLDEILRDQHKVMYPHIYETSGPAPMTSGGPIYPPNPDLPGPKPTPSPTPVAVEQCPVCWHRETGICANCGGALGGCNACPHGMPTA